MPVRPPSPAAGPSVSPCAMLLPELREVIAGKLEARDAIALSQVSHAWQEATDPLWERAYGARPCHMPASTPAQWRAATKQKLQIQQRLQAPLPANPPGPAAWLGEGRRLAAGSAGLPALIAFDLAGEAGRTERAAMALWIGRLRRQGRQEELRAYAAAALQAHPDLATPVMNAGVQLDDVELCKLADAAGSELRDAFNFCPVETVKTGDRAIFTYLLARPRRTTAGQWEQALALALHTRQGDLLWEFARDGRGVGMQLDLGRLLPQIANLGELSLAHALLAFHVRRLGFDLAQIADPAARGAFLQLLHAAGLDPKATLQATASSDAAHAQEACQQLGVALYTPEAWQQVLDELCDDALDRPYSADLRQLRVVCALGGRGSDLEAAGRRLLHSWHNSSSPLKWVTVLLAAGASPQLCPAGLSLERMIGPLLLTTPAADLRACLPLVAQAGCRLDQAALQAASRALETASFDAQILASLLDMGYPARTRGLLLMCADAGSLEAVHMLLQRGADPFDYDDRFRTAVDYARQPELLAYLATQGLTPMPVPADSPWTHLRPLLQDAPWRAARGGA